MAGVSNEQLALWRTQVRDMAITCPVCDMTSHNPNDIENGYCGNCHAYTGTVNPMMQAKRMVDEAHKRADP
jgi:hypothetical protein